MSFGFGFALPHWQTLSGGFSPASLFSANEVGAWYDPSDLTTLFQDSAGTTPVTAVEQPVGLMLDKSKGLVLGPELIADYTQGYTASGTANVALSGAEVIATADGSSANPGYYYAISTVVGQQYYVTGVLRSPTTNTMYLAANSNTSVFSLISRASSFSASSTQVGFFFTAVGTTTYIFVYGSTSTVGNAYAARNISVKYRPGNHATQPTSTSRPTLRARYNLLTYSEQFDNLAWIRFRSAATANATVAPDGTTTADKLVPSAGLTGGFVYNSAAVISTVGTSYVASVYVKAAELGFVFVAINNRASSTAAGVCVNLTDGSTSNAGASGTYTVTSVGSGWWSITAASAATNANGYLEVSPLAVAGSYGSYTGDGTSGIFIWGAQLTQTAVFPSNTYQRIAAATDYATGAAFPPYLFFDGVDDSLLTNSVDFSATDKMTVWAGVTKSSDAASGILAELSNNISTNNGSFYVSAPESTTVRYGVLSRGDAILNANQLASTLSNTYLAPITNVLTGTFNISGDSTILRLNGVQISQATGDQGLGNFGNYPLYIGRRGNVNIPLNGNIYSLIIRGAQSTAAQISSTESWVAAKTPLGSL